MNLNDFFSKPSHVKEAYSNNYPSYTPPAAATDVSSDSDSEPKFNRLNKTGSQPEFNFRTGLASDDETDYETENEPELGTFRMGKPVEPDDAATQAFMAALTPSQQDNRFTAPAGWRYVEKDEDPARYGSAPAATSALPNLIYDPQSRSLKSADAPALDLTPKSKFKFDRTTQSQISADGSGANPNIDNATRDRARAWAAKQNAVAPVKPVAAPAVVKPAVVPPAALRDIPVEKPSSWKDIAQANNIANPNRIMPGQKLKIPGRADYVVQPGDTLGKIAAGQTKAPKYTPTASDTQPAATAVLKKNPNLGLNFPLPPSVLDNLGMGGTRKEIAKQGREQLLTPAMIKSQREADLIRTPADVERALAANLKANNERIAARDAAASRKKVKEDDMDEQTVPNEFKWGAPSWTARDGTVLAYDKKTNAYNMSSGPTKPDPNTMWSGIQTQRTTMKNGQPVNAFDRTTIAVNPATGAGHYNRSSQEGDNEPTIIHRRDVPADELAKLRADAGIPPKADDIDEADYSLGYQDNQLPFVDPRASYVMPANAAEREQDVKDFGHLTKNQNLGNPASLVNKNVTPSNKTVPFGQNNRTTASYDMPANDAERAADLKDYGPLTSKFNLGSNRAPAMEINRESLDRMRSLAGIHKK